jgi:lysine biosynthesis protein LysW
MATATCIECDEEIAISGRPRLGMKVVCSHCGARLEIVNLAPVEVDWAFDDEDEDEDDTWGEEELDLEDDLADDNLLDDDDDVEADDDDWR